MTEMSRRQLICTWVRLPNAFHRSSERKQHISSVGRVQMERNELEALRGSEIWLEYYYFFFPLRFYQLCQFDLIFSTFLRILASHSASAFAFTLGIDNGPKDVEKKSKKHTHVLVEWNIQRWNNLFMQRTTINRRIDFRRFGKHQ